MGTNISCSNFDANCVTKRKTSFMQEKSENVKFISLKIPTYTFNTNNKNRGLTSFINIPKWDWKLVKDLINLVGINVLGLAVNTYCLMYVEASLYQVT